MTAGAYVVWYSAPGEGVGFQRFSANFALHDDALETVAEAHDAIRRSATDALHTDGWRDLPDGLAILVVGPVSEPIVDSEAATTAAEMLADQFDGAEATVFTHRTRWEES